MGRRNFQYNFMIVFLVLVQLYSCGKDGDKKRVVFIGVDGLLKRCMKEANTTSFDYFKQEGSYTMNARTVIETTSGPGWVSILCGMSSEETGVFDNAWAAPWMYGRKAKISSITNDEAFPCLFSELKKNQQDLNIKVSWDWNWFINIGNTSIPGSIDKEYFCDPYPDRDIISYDKCDLLMLRNAMESIEEDYDLLFVYFISVDQAGHLFNFCSDEYIQRISTINAYVEKIIEGLKAKGMFDNTYLILTTDHGASYMKKWHGFQDDDNLITPLYLMGPGIKKNNEMKENIQNKDVAATIMRLFGFESNKEWSAKVIEEAFETYVVNDLENVNGKKGRREVFNKLKFLEK